LDNVATGAVADTIKTMLSIIVADTAGHRCALRGLNVGFADDAPADRNVAIQIKRIEDVSAGTAGTKTAVAVADIAKMDPGSIAPLMSGGRNYTVEPTAYDAEELFAQDLNDRGGIVKEWDFEDAPKFIADQLCGLCAAPRTANAATLSGGLLFQMY
jgi:hypothetical protein